MQLLAQAVDDGLSPRGRGNRLGLASQQQVSRSIPAWAGEPLFRQYQQGWNIAEANYRHFSKLVVRWLMIFDQVYSVRIHNLLWRLAQGADLLLAHGRRVTPGHHYRSLAQLVVPLCQNVPYPLPYRSIPAWAGEPAVPLDGGLFDAVYPRVGGGTDTRRAKEEAAEGLSPRGRGNPVVTAIAAGSNRSIPAWAGEPIWPMLQS